MPLVVPNRRVLAPVARAVALAVLLVGVVLAVPAHAHSEDGVMEVIAVESPAPLQISAEVGIVYANDDDLAVDATVSVTATGPSGETVGPVDVPNRDSAVYAATFDVPAAGTWSLAFASTSPVAEATAEVEVVEPASSTTTTPTTSEASPTTTSAPEVTAAGQPPDDDESATAATEDGDDDSGSNLLAVVVIGLVLTAAVAAVALAARRRSAADPEAPAAG